MLPSAAPAAGRLHLIPVPLVDAPAGAPGNALCALPPETLVAARAAHYFLVENARSARAFLKAIGHPQAIASLQIIEIGHAPDPAQIDGWLAPLLGNPATGASPLDAVLLSEAGCPGIADPGASIVARAHERGLVVQAWIGPSSILLALMAAGMNGQSFRFLGYLPQDREELRLRLLDVQDDAYSGETQIFIETPYRNLRMLEVLLQTCAPSLRLCVAVALSGADQAVHTRTIAQWLALAPAQLPPLDRRPAVFLLHGAPHGAPTGQQRSSSQSRSGAMASKTASGRRRSSAARG